MRGTSSGTFNNGRSSFLLGVFPRNYGRCVVAVPVNRNPIFVAFWLVALQVSIGVALLLPRCAQAGPFDGWEHWWRTQSSLSPRVEAELTLGTGATTYTPKGGGAAALGRTSALKVAKTALPATSRTIPLVVERLLSKDALKVLVKNGAKSFGPWAVLIPLATVVFDELLNEWRKPNEYLSGCWKVSTEPCQVSPYAACQYHGTIISKVLTATKVTDYTWTCIRVSDGGANGTASLTNAGPAGTSTATDDDLVADIDASLTANPSLAGQQAERTAEALGEQALTEASTGPTVDGPASSSPTTQTTTTTSGGITTVTTVTNEFTYNYSGDTVQVTNTETTTECVDGVCETITEVETGDAPGQTQEETEYPDFCVDHPEASACAPLDSVAPEDMPTETRDISWSSEKTAAGSCPAALEIHSELFNDDFQIEYTPICTVAGWMRPLIIGMAWLSAGIYVFLMVRREVG